MGAMVLHSPTDALAQREVHHPQSVPYTDIMTSKMQRPLEKEITKGTENIEMQRIESSSAHNQAKFRNFINLVCIMFLFGAFCAIWAQNTARNPMLWFLAGACFTFVTVGLILRKNAKIQRRKRYRRNGSSYVDFAQFH